MTASALAHPASPPELFWYDEQRSPSVKLGVLELEDGNWLALPPGFHVDAPRFDTRGAALRVAIARTVLQGRRYMRAKDGEGTRWTEGYAGRIIEWALSLKPATYLDVPKGTLVQAATADVEAPINHPVSEVAASANDRVIEDSTSENSGGLKQPIPEAEKDALGITDPIIRSLIESHRSRKTWPAGHTFSMTNPTVNGQWVTLGTCTCGETFSYAYGSAGHERMDAAIEAHWQKFDAGADRIDGRGNPIDAEDWTWNLASDAAINRSHPVRMTCESDGLASFNIAVCQCGWTFRVKASFEGRDARDKAVKAHWQELSEATEKANPKKKRKKKSQPDAPGRPASIASAPVLVGTIGADALLSELAEAGPHTAPRSEPAPHAPPSGAGSPLLASDMAAEPADDWSPLLLAALDLAWREEIPPPDPVKEFEQSLPPLMGPEEKRRKVTEFKLAVRQKPVNLGPLFGEVPPPPRRQQPNGG